jgi:anaerobic selenocysteine-containing dehydrogenase
MKRAFLILALAFLALLASSPAFCEIKGDHYDSISITGKVSVTKDAKGKPECVTITSEDGKTLQIKEAKVVDANNPKKTIWEVSKSDVLRMAKLENRIVKLNAKHKNGLAVKLGAVSLMDIEGQRF